MARFPRCSPRRWLPVATCSLVLLLASLGALPAQDSDPSGEPKIVLFQILPTTEEGVQWHEFHWQVVNTHRVRLFADGSEMPGRSQQSDGSIGWNLSMSGTMRMRLKATTTFELVAENQAGGSVSERRVAEVGSPKGPGKPPREPAPETLEMSETSETSEKPSSPTIKVFRVRPATAEPGAEIQLAWDVENAHSIRIFEGDHEIDLRGLENTLSTGGVAGLSTTIDQTTTFRLVAADRYRRTASKTFTVRVGGAAEPGARCVVEGRLEGKWRQEIRERPTGPATPWTVAVYVFAAGSDRPAGHATVDNQGVYRVSDLSAGTSYRLRPDWDSVPREANISCRAGETRQGPRFRITGSPRID